MDSRILDIYPSRIQIGLYSYEIRWTDDAHVRCCDGNKGTAVHSSKVFFINKDSQPFELLETFFHEILHGGYNCFGIAETHKGEDCVSLNAVIITMVFRDNPWLVDFVKSIIDS